MMVLFDIKREARDGKSTLHGERQADATPAGKGLPALPFWIRRRLGNSPHLKPGTRKQPRLLCDRQFFGTHRA